MKATALLWLLQRDLGYVVARHAGTFHRRLVAPGRPALTFAFHDKDTVGPLIVRDIAVKQVGLGTGLARSPPWSTTSAVTR